MELIRGVHNLRPRHAGCVATIGNFDGLHRGHRAMVEAVRRQARDRDEKAAVMLFEPQPVEFFAPDKAPPRLMTLRDKLRALAELEVDQVLCARFDDQFRSRSARNFVQQLLVDGLGVRHLVVGDDFRFGQDRAGDFDYLKTAGQEFGFTVEDTPTCEHDGARVSSTRIREALADGDLISAEALLGRPYSISGRVRHGDEIGRTIDVPTANLQPGHNRMAVAGVYAVTVTGGGLHDAPAVASVGRRPTVAGRENRVEVHVLDFAGDLYEQHLDVAFRHFIRPEEKYDGLEALKSAIRRDIEQARTYFANGHP
jgi:riboflavin kinase/FMN adenylyltransferase